jgi:hypothetical protein
MAQSTGFIDGSSAVSCQQTAEQEGAMGRLGVARCPCGLDLASVHEARLGVSFSRLLSVAGNGYERACGRGNGK